MKLKRLFCLTALVLCMGAFSVPAFAAEAPDTTPPSISASIQGDALQISVRDDSGVEAVFVNDQRLNYRIDSALELPVADYATDEEYITLYAMDFAGNKSKVVKLKNPLLPPEEKPFTPAGTGTVQDNATDGDGKEFFTIITPNENEFFLVIDRQRESENVYLLNSVTEEDLRALAVKDKEPEPEPTPAPAPEPTPEPEPEAPPAKSGVNGGTIFFILLAVGAAGGAGYYFKIVRPKQQAALPDEFDEDEDEENEDDYDKDFLTDSDIPSDDSDPEKEE